MSDVSIRLSIVIPAYNEESRLGSTLDTVFAWVDVEPFGVEVIVVDDGSTDATVALVESRASSESRLRVVSNGSNRGKGFSVGHGVEVAHGELILFSDADLSTPITEFERLHTALEGHDIAIASRALPDSRLEKRQAQYRELMGRTFNLIVLSLVFPGIHDTHRSPGSGRVE